MKKDANFIAKMLLQISEFTLLIAQTTIEFAGKEEVARRNFFATKVQ